MNGQNGKQGTMAYLKNIYLGKKDNKDRDQYDFTLEPEHAMNIASALMQQAQSGQISRLSFRVGQKYSQQNQRWFNSGFALVNAVQPRSTAPQGQRQYVPQQPPQPGYATQAQPPQQSAQAAYAPSQTLPNYAPGATDPAAQAARINQSIQGQNGDYNGNGGVPF